MTVSTPIVPNRPGLLMRVVLAIPILGTIIRDIGRDRDSIFYALVILLTLVVLAVRIWGLAALTMTALLLVPVMFVVLVIITRG